jgi:hypothetical protein
MFLVVASDYLNELPKLFIHEWLAVAVEKPQLPSVAEFLWDCLSFAIGASASTSASLSLLVASLFPII